MFDYQLFVQVTQLKGEKTSVHQQIIALQCLAGVSICVPPSCVAGPLRLANARHQATHRGGLAACR